MSLRRALPVLIWLFLGACSRRTEAPRPVERVDASARDVPPPRDVVTDTTPPSAPDVARMADADATIEPPTRRAEASEIVARCRRRREGLFGVVINSGARDAGTRPPSVTMEPMEPAEAIATLDQGQVEEALRANLRAIGACFEQSLRAQPTLHGYVQMNVTLSPDGRARHITFTTHREPTLERCVSQSVRATRFPSSDGDEFQFSVQIIFCNGSE